MMPELYTRLLAEEKQRVDFAVKLARKGVDPVNIGNRVLPWAVELGIGDSILGVTGRIDQVYKCNNLLTPIDFKTHTNRFSSWLWRDAHSEQIAVYALLLEQQYRGHRVKNGFIKYTQDLYDHLVKLPIDNKNIIVNHVEQARALLGDKIPQRLRGEEAIKCNYCHLKEFCFKITDPEVN
jgi:CRISPR/Cas system-associated exonuclease Cas4 (RecB family)